MIGSLWPWWCFPDLFNLQPVTPDPLQEVTETSNQGVLLHTCDANLAVTQLHGLSAHLLYQHSFRLQTKKLNKKERTYANTENSN